MAITVTAAHVAESYDSGNMKEDVSDIIFNIDPLDTPCLTLSGKRDVGNTTFEWNEESLPSSDATNAKKEGADFTSEEVQQVVRRTNYTQISTRNAVVSGTQSSVSQYGKTSEMAHQLEIKSKALKLDIEKALVSHNAGVAGAGDGATARQTESIPHMVARGSNFKAKASSGTSAPGSATAAFTEGSATEELTESIFMELAQSVYENGGEMKAVVCGPGLKREISDFQGRSGTQVIVDPEKVSNNITIVASDFGDLKILTSRSMGTFGSSGAAGTDLLMADWQYLKVAFLRNFSKQQIAKQGDSDAQQLIAEWGAECSNFDSCGIRTNLTNAYAGITA